MSIYLELYGFLKILQRYFAYHFYYFIYFIVVPVQLSPFSPHHPPFSPPSPPPTLELNPFCFVHVSFIHVSWWPFPYYSLLSLSPLLSGYYRFVLYFNVSGCILLACLFCWLGSTYRWDHMVLFLKFITRHTYFFYCSV